MAISTNQILPKLIKTGIDCPKLEARMIKEHADKHNLSEDQINQIINERINGRPLDKILGIKGFYKHDFYVNDDVLSPRPDTETLVETAIKIIRQSLSPIPVLDLGTGSGCILLSILKDCLNTQGVGIDISEKALKTARKNAENLGLSDRTIFIQADWFGDDISSCVKEEQELSKTCFGKSSGEFKQIINRTTFDLIVSNPPYIPSADIPTLDPEVKNHDPILALDGGQDGLDSYKKLAQITPQLLKKGGCILLEVGINQTQDVKKIFTNQNLTPLQTIPDLSGLDRCLIFQK